jgi:hypothetical protein
MIERFKDAIEKVTAAAICEIVRMNHQSRFMIFCFKSHEAEIVFSNELL